MQTRTGTSQSSFEFEPTFDKLEKFLRFYQKAHETGEPRNIEMNLPDFYWNSLVGYPQVEQNCWLTLRYAVDQMNRSHSLGKSLVRIEISQKEQL